MDSDLSAPLPIAQWLVAGALFAFLILAAAVVREMGDRSIEDSHRDFTYQRLGLSWRATGRLAWVTMLIPLVTATATGFVCSLFIAYSGDVLQIARNDTLRLLFLAGISLMLPLGALALSVPVRRAAARAGSGAGHT